MNTSNKRVRKNIVRIALPSLLTILLFLIAFIGIVLPAFRSTLMTQKKSMIAAVTQSAEDILYYYEGQVQSGALSLEIAQSMAMDQIGKLRYGAEHKDYLWINDLQPRMIMHPYRPDLEGKDLSLFADSSGKLLFVEMVSVAKKDGHGYVDYFWQWKDNADRIVPKLSYVRLFGPWGWILGTGVYLDDVSAEMAQLTKELISISAVIFVIILVLSFYIIRRSMHEQTERSRAEDELITYKEHLEELVEKRTEELQKALAEVKTLSGFLPICASCKKIRDDKGYWNQIEIYIRDRSEAEFTHSICPDCAKTLYGLE